MKKLLIIFVVALVLNIIWENAHSLLYSNYMDGQITEFILIRASLFDALVITIILLPFIYLNKLKNKTWLIIIIGVIVAVFNEWYGLNTGRWEYNSLMPILPIIKVGLTPTIQLAVLGYLLLKIEEYVSNKFSF
jgi:hypothetical protein